MKKRQRGCERKHVIAMRQLMNSFSSLRSSKCIMYIENTRHSSNMFSLYLLLLRMTYQCSFYSSVRYSLATCSHVSMNCFHANETTPTTRCTRNVRRKSEIHVCLNLHANWEVTCPVLHLRWADELTGMPAPPPPPLLADWMSVLSVTQATHGAVDCWLTFRATSGPFARNRRAKSWTFVNFD